MAWLQIQSPGVLTADPSATSIALAFTSNVTSGHLIVAVACWSNAAAENASCSDTLGTSYSRVQTPGTWDTTGQYGCQVFYGVAPSGGSNTVTINNYGGTSASRAFRLLAIYEFSGNNSSSLLNQSKFLANVGGATGTDGMSSGSATTTGNGCLIFGIEQACRSGSPGTASAGTGFTAGVTSGAYLYLSEYRTQTTAGSVASTFTHSIGGNTWIEGYAAFNPAGASGGTVTAVAAAASAAIPTSGGAVEVDVDLSYAVH